ncbi:FAD-dependent oxidoreductase [Nonomuraea sp. CA-218870]|uniref:FAD-dependent oxidoreductase n=1 Tax=Nonomuraea sp. CA-218870 TaxID=3239998 RepID=UPI003D8C17AA
MDVVVYGAGVAGAALACWLRQHGFTPTVVERAGGYATGLRGRCWTCWTGWPCWTRSEH